MNIVISCQVVFFVCCLNRTLPVAMLPLGAGGVTEMFGMGRWGEGEGPTESSDVCDFPAPLVQGLGEDCEGPAGLWTNEEQKREHHLKAKFTQ